MNIVELQQASKYYQGVTALQKLDFSLEQGEILGLFGHNGAGKTTTIKLILGLIKPTNGQVRVFGDDPAGDNAYHLRRQLGFLQENVSFYDQMTGREVLAYFAKLKGCDKKQVGELLEEVGLAHAALRRVKTYSKGMRQRLGLAQALLGQPKLLLLDEPTVGLDPIATQDFYRGIARLKEQGSTIILCSHALAGVEKYIDRALILGQGQLLAEGKLTSLIEQTELPVTIAVQGSNIVLPEELQVKATATAQGFNVQVSQQQKMTTLQQLMTLPALGNIDIHMPSLEDVYTHYMNGNQHTEQH
ncbi:MAG: ABC transporter ATP-binding protein [Piscirickettsiaceae bacterium]|nr:ABC transporter ATP-binding protein [Piscirickettsiaceae bacterium]